MKKIIVLGICLLIIISSVGAFTLDLQLNDLRKVLLNINTKNNGVKVFTPQDWQQNGTVEHRNVYVCYQQTQIRRYIPEDAYICLGDSLKNSTIKICSNAFIQQKEYCNVKGQYWQQCERNWKNLRILRETIR